MWTDEVVSGCVKDLVDSVALAGVAEQPLSLAILRFIAGGLLFGSFLLFNMLLPSLSFLFPFPSFSSACFFFFIFSVFFQDRAFMAC